MQNDNLKKKKKEATDFHVINTYCTRSCSPYKILAILRMSSFLRIFQPASSTRVTDIFTTFEALVEVQFASSGRDE